MIKGIIFDMDGVLVDSEKLYMRFWQEACKSYGYELSDENALSLRSNSAETAAPKFIEWFGSGADYNMLRDKRRMLMSEYIESNGVDLKNGAKEALNSIKAMSIKIALATASPIERAERYLAPYGLFDIFDVTVSGHNLTKSKPAPDIYIYAAKSLELPCDECIAVEDSPSGIISAHDAGCFTVMIPDLTEPNEEIITLIDKKLSSLTELTSLLNELNEPFKA